MYQTQEEKNWKRKQYSHFGKNFLNESENWKEINEKQCYQFSGIFSSPTVQHRHYTPDMKSLHQSSETDTKFLRTDIQLLKGQLNKKC